MDGILLHPSDGRAYSLSEPGFPIRSRCLLGEPDVDEFPALGISTTTASNSPCVGPLMIGSSRRFVERLIPWASLVDACFKRSRDEPADFFSLQRHKLVLVVLVELRTEIQRVDTGIISVHYEKVPRFSKQAVSLYDLSFGRGLRDPQLIPRLADDGAGLQQDDPVLLPGIVRMDRDKMTCWPSS